MQEGFADSTLGDQEIALLAETFTKINSAYFSGHPTREEDHTDGLALWRTQAGFHIRYIETMLKAGAREHLTLQIR